MDHHLFDTLTLTFVRTVSRRRALRTIVAGLAGGLLETTARGAAARPGTCLGAGQACDARHGCCSHTCCAGICCADDEKCLGRRRHRSTELGPICCPESQVAVDHCCAPGEIGCFKTCCPSETVACGAPTHLPDGTFLPGTCVCPEGAVYQNGACCLVLNEFCAENGECCSGHCESHAGKTPSCCLPNGSACTDWHECCASTCLDGHCCMDTGGSCGVDSDCCRDLPCTDGRCGFAVGHTCTANTECSTRGCRSGVCCIKEADSSFTCTADGECCSGAICVGGQCCLTTGQSCPVDTIPNGCCSGTCQDDGTCS